MCEGEGRQDSLCHVQVHKRTDDGLGIDAYYHQEVREGPKGSAIGAHLKLGKPLEIAFLGAKDGLEQYEDLDEILARFAEPFVAHVKQIKCHRQAGQSTCHAECHVALQCMLGGTPSYGQVS